MTLTRYIAVIIFGCIFATGTVAQVYISSVQVSGNERFSRREIAGWLELKPGDVFDELVLEQGLNRILDRFAAEGYYFAAIDSVRRDFSVDSSRVTLTILIDEGGETFLDGVEVTDSQGEKRSELEDEFRIGSDFSPRDFEFGVEEVLQRVESGGYPFAQLRVKRLDFSRVDKGGLLGADLELKRGPQVILLGVEVEGNRSTRDWVIARESRLDSGRLFSPASFSKARKRLLRTGLFEEVEEPGIIRRFDDYYALLKVKEGRHNSLDGALGYYPGSGEENGYWTGLVDISLGNIFGTMRRFHLHWEQPERNSQDIALSYREPWLGGIPLDLSGALSQSVRGISSFSSSGGDDRYISRSAVLEALYPLSESLEISGGLTYDEILPDSAARHTLGIPNSLSRGVRAGFVIDTRDNRLNPRRGLMYRSFARVYSKKNFAAPGSQLPGEVEERRLEADFEVVYSLWKDNVVDLRLQGRQLNSDQKRIPVSEMYFLGGMSSLRGYREEQFAGDFIAWVNLEYRYIIGKYSRLFVFDDWGYFSQEGVGGTVEGWKHGFGAGFRLKTGAGIIGVEYGLGEGDSPMEGKVHIRLRNEF